MFIFQTLLSQLFRRLKLKDKQFKLFSAASEADLNDLWGELFKSGNPPDGKRKQDIKKFKGLLCINIIHLKIR